MDKLLIFIGNLTVFFLIFQGLNYISNEGFFLKTEIKTYYQQIKNRINALPKLAMNKFLNSTKEFLKSVYNNQQYKLNQIIIENHNDYDFVNCYVEIFLYINLKNLSVDSNSQSIKKDLIKNYFQRCRYYLENKDNYNKELIDFLETHYDKNDEVYYG